MTLISTTFADTLNLLETRLGASNSYLSLVTTTKALFVYALRQLAWSVLSNIGYKYPSTVHSTDNHD